MVHSKIQKLSKLTTKTRKRNKLAQVKLNLTHEVDVHRHKRKLLIWRQVLFLTKFWSRWYVDCLYLTDDSICILSAHSYSTKHHHPVTGMEGTTWSHWYAQTHQKKTRHLMQLGVRCPAHRHFIDHSTPWAAPMLILVLYLRMSLFCFYSETLRIM